MKCIIYIIINALISYELITDLHRSITSLYIYIYIL